MTPNIASPKVAAFARAVMTLLAVAVALFSLRFLGVPFGRWIQIDPGIRGVVETVPVSALAHMLVAPVALATGAFQFFPGVRAKRPRLHRWAGRLYVSACMIAGVAGFSTALHASGGPIASFGFALLAVCWIGATLAGWFAARRRDFIAHRMWMTYSYAMTFGAVTLRLQIPLGFVLGWHSYSAMSVWLAYTAWIPNLAAVFIWRWASQRNIRRPAMTRGQGRTP